MTMMTGVLFLAAQWIFGVGALPIFAPGSTILFQGDSITSGFRAGDLNGPYGQCYVWEIAAHYQAEHACDHVEFANRGVPGDTSSNVVARWSADAFPYAVRENGYEGVFGRKEGSKVVPDHLSVLVGINDYYYSRVGDPRAVSCEQYEANMRKMIEDARTVNPAVKITLCEPFRIPVDATPDFCRRQDVVAKLAAEYDCAFVPFQKLFGEDLLKKNANPRYWFWDFFHPTPAGHYRMADFWIDSVARYQTRTHRNTALEPRAQLEKDSYDWYARHEDIVKRQKALDPEVVFIGDSITHGWEANDNLRGNAKAVFDKWFGKCRPLNMGFGWDRIQNVLWRLSHGEMDGMRPKAVVILIGTNNTAPGYAKPFPANTADEIAEGVVEVCRRVREKAPAAKIVLMDVFPRGAKDSASRRDVMRVNAALGPKVAALADENLVRLNLWDRFVGADGEIPKELMFDGLHPTAKGYDLWGAALQDVIGRCFPARTADVQEYGPTIRDRCWMLGHDPGQHDARGNVFKIPPSAPVSQAEGCISMGISNVCVVVWDHPDEAYCRQFKALKRVSWAADNGWLKQVQGKDVYARQMPYIESRLEAIPNLTGVDFDDFFYMEPRPESVVQTLDDGTQAVVAVGPLTQKEIVAAKRRVASWGRPCDMRIVVYSRDLGVPGIKPVIDVFDTVLFWTWDGCDLARLPENFVRYRRLFPDKPTILGIYMWDFGGRRPIGEKAMADQLAFALEKLHTGEIQGVMFHNTALANKDIPEIRMVRRWIAEHGEETVGDRPPRKSSAIFEPGG